MQAPSVHYVERTQMLANPRRLATKVLTASSHSCLASMSLTLFNRLDCFSTAAFSMSSNSPATDPMVSWSFLLSETSAHCRSWSRKFSSVVFDPVAYHLHSSLKNPKSCWLHPVVRTGRTKFCSWSRGPLGLDSTLSTSFNSGSTTGPGLGVMNWAHLLFHG